MADYRPIQDSAPWVQGSMYPTNAKGPARYTGIDYDRYNKGDQFYHCWMCPGETFVFHTDSNGIPKPSNSKARTIMSMQQQVTEQPKPSMDLKLRNLAAFGNENITTVVCRHGKNSQPLTFKILRELAITVKAGGYVACETAHGLSILEVLCVHDENEIDIDSGLDYKWAFAAVDVEVLEKIKKDEDEVVKSVKTSQRKKIQTKLYEDIFKDQPVKIGQD